MNVLVLFCGITIVVSSKICTKRLIGDEWIADGDCENYSEILSEIIKDLGARTMLQSPASSTTTKIAKRTRGKTCIKKHINNNWVTEGDCEDFSDILSEIKKDLGPRATPKPPASFTTAETTERTQDLGPGATRQPPASLTTAELTKRIQGSQPAACAAKGGFHYSRGKCFIFILKSATYDEAKQLCSSNKSSLAEFSDEDQEIEVLRAMRTTISESELWIGMKYIDSRKQVEYVSGKRISYDQFLWHYGNPNGNDTGIVVEAHETEDHFGFKNQAPSTPHHGGLCEKLLL